MDFTNPAKFNCDHQGVSVGGHDEYHASLPCQFIEIDGISDGEYEFEATANAYSVKAAQKGEGKVLIEEDNYDDNTESIRIKITGHSVEII